MIDRRAKSSGRLAGVAARASLANEDVYVHVASGWRYIPVHPFADDSAVLARISWPSERCTNVDAYWEYSGDVHFVQVHTRERDIREVGCYYRWADNDGYAVNFVAVLEDHPIVRAEFEAILSLLAESLPSLGNVQGLTPLPRQEPHR